MEKKELEILEKVLRELQDIKVIIQENLEDEDLNTKK